MVDVTAAGRVDTRDSASIDVSLNAGAVVCDDHEYGGVVIPAPHALQLLVRRRVAQPPAQISNFQTLNFQIQNLNSKA